MAIGLFDFRALGYPSNLGATTNRQCACWPRGWRLGMASAQSMVLGRSLVLGPMEQGAHQPMDHVVVFSRFFENDAVV